MGQLGFSPARSISEPLNSSVSDTYNHFITVFQVLHFKIHIEVHCINKAKTIKKLKQLFFF